MAGAHAARRYTDDDRAALEATLSFTASSRLKRGMRMPTITTMRVFHEAVCRKATTVPAEPGALPCTEGCGPIACNCVNCATGWNLSGRHERVVKAILSGDGLRPRLCGRVADAGAFL